MAALWSAVIRSFSKKTRIFECRDRKDYRKGPRADRENCGSALIQDGRYLCCRVSGKHSVFLFYPVNSVVKIVPSERQKVRLWIRAPIRIGQGIEFDYCTVHAVQSLREESVEVHIVNNNPSNTQLSQ